MTVNRSGNNWCAVLESDGSVAMTAAQLRMLNHPSEHGLLFASFAYEPRSAYGQWSINFSDFIILRRRDSLCFLMWYNHFVRHFITTSRWWYHYRRTLLSYKSKPMQTYRVDYNRCLNLQDYSKSKLWIILFGRTFNFGFIVRNSS